MNQSKNYNKKEFNIALQNIYNKNKYNFFVKTKYY